MIMARNEDGTYSQVGFIKDKYGNDITEYIYDKDGNIAFERGFTREVEGSLPLQINGIGKDLKEYSITGNTVQDGTPTPENPVEVLGCGERTANLFDIKKATFGKFMAENKEVVSSTAVHSDYIDVSPNETYWISNFISQPRFYTGCEYNANKEFIRYIDLPRNAVSGTITTSEEGKYIVLNTDSNLSDNSFIAKSSTEIPYEPYGYKIPVVTSADGAEPITTPIYLPTPLYSGEVMRSEGSREVKWGKLVLTGKETISKNTNESTNYLYYMPISTNKKINGYCSHLISMNGAPMSVIGFNTNSSFSVIYFNFGADIMNAQPSGNTIAGFKEYLSSQYAAGTPVTIWYQLTKPTTETFTAPQIPTLNGTTVIDVDTAVKPTEMYTKYKSSK